MTLGQMTLFFSNLHHLRSRSAEMRQVNVIAGGSPVQRTKAKLHARIAQSKKTNALQRIPLWTRLCSHGRPMSVHVNAHDDASANIREHVEWAIAKTRNFGGCQKAH